MYTSTNTHTWDGSLVVRRPRGSGLFAFTHSDPNYSWQGDINMSPFERNAQKMWGTLIRPGAGIRWNMVYAI